MAETKMPSTEEYNNLKQQLNALSQEKADLEILRDLINKLSPVTGLENLISHILTVAMDIAGSEKVTAYYRLDKHCVSIDAYGKKNEFDCFDDPLVIESIEKLAIIEKPSGRQPSTKKSDKSSSAAATLVFPLIVGENVIGAVKIENITGNSKEIQWKLQPFMNYVAVILNNEIKNSCELNAAYQKLQETNAKLQEEINKHIKTEEQLQEKSDTLKTIFESMQIGIVIINPETHRIVYANPTAVKLIRAPREKIVGAECHRFICPAEKGKCPVTDLGQNVDNSERILITADWEERPIIKTVSHINISGREHLLETFIDITERKLAEEEKAKLLNDLNERVKELDCLYGISRLVDTPEITLEGILQGTANLIPPAFQHPDITCSRIILESREFKTDNFKNTKLKQSVDIKVHKEKAGSIEVCLLEQKLKDNEKPFLKEESTLLETIAERIGKTIERKKTEALLTESRDRLEKTQEMAHLGSWELDVVNNVLTWSDEVYRIFGLKPQEFTATYEAFLEAVHPDDRAAVDAAYSSSLRKGKDAYRIEHRVVRKTGEIRIVYEKCEHIRDVEGKIIRSIGMVHDITNRKLAEKEVLESAKEWHRTFDSISDLVFIQDNEHVILRANKAFYDALKSRPEDIVGKKCFEVLHKANSPWPNCPFEKTKKDQQTHTEEVDDKNIGIPLLITTSPIFNEKGELIGSVHIAKDISERKKSEEELAFKNAILTTQQEASIDGILVVDGKGKIISFNQRFVEMWGISSEIIESKSDERALQAVIKEVADPIPFLTKVRYLYEHYHDTSRDEILLNDGRTFDRYSAPMFGDKDKYYGRVWYFRDITDHKQAEEKLIELSLMDELTGLNNRRGFSILAAKQIKTADRYKHGLTLIYIDLDNMKWINDNLGHKEGDRALVDISNIFKKSFRSSDIIARLGGDEFAGLVVDSRGTTSDMILARMQESINELNSQKTRTYTLSISFGAISYDNENPCSLNELLARGDKAMYEHKQKKGVRRGEKN